MAFNEQGKGTRDANSGEIPRSSYFKLDEEGDALVLPPVFKPVIHFGTHTWQETSDQEHVPRRVRDYFNSTVSRLIHKIDDLHGVYEQVRPSVVVVAHEGAMAFTIKKPFAIWTNPVDDEKQVGLEHRVEEGTSLDGVQTILSAILGIKPKVVVIKRNEESYDMYLRNS